jgi:hypothetical protein
MRYISIVYLGSVKSAVGEERWRRLSKVAFLSIATILLSLYILNITNQNAYDIADYHMNQQITFYKQAAAQQLLMEIDAMNSSILHYTNYL